MTSFIKHFYNNPPKGEWSKILARPNPGGADISALVADILVAVKEKGDLAIIDFNTRFDGFSNASFEVSEEEIKEFKKYEKIVRLNTSKNYRKYKDIINPKNLILKRGHNNLDHKYSISQGFIDKVPPKIISSVENLEILTEQENLIKGKKCSIILSELIEKTKYL